MAMVLFLLSGVAHAAEAATGSCTSWSGQGNLQDVVRDETCVEIQPGTYVLTRYLVIPDGHTLPGNPSVARDDIVLQAPRPCCAHAIDRG